MIIILNCNHEFFSENSKQKIVDDFIDYALDGINYSMSEARINMKRLAKLMESLLYIKFYGFDEYGVNLSEEERVEKIEKLKSLVEDGEKQDICSIVKESRIRRAEEFYANMLSKESNPLAKVIVVGLLRAMLKLATLNRGNSSNDKCN